MIAETAERTVGVEVKLVLPSRHYADPRRAGRPSRRPRVRRPDTGTPNRSWRPCGFAETCGSRPSTRSTRCWVVPAPPGTGIRGRLDRRPRAPHHNRLHTRQRRRCRIAAEPVDLALAIPTDYVSRCAAESGIRRCRPARSILTRMSYAAAAVRSPMATASASRSVVSFTVRPWRRP